MNIVNHSVFPELTVYIESKMKPSFENLRPGSVISLHADKTELRRFSTLHDNEFCESSYAVYINKNNIHVYSKGQLGYLFALRTVIDLFLRKKIQNEYFDVQIPVIKERQICGNPFTLEKIPDLFDLLLQAGINQFVFMPPDFMYIKDWDQKNGGHLDANGSSPPDFPYGLDSYPGFKKYADMKEIKRQMDLLAKCCWFAKLTGIKIYFLLLIPKFPVNTKKVIRELYPELLDNGGEFDPENGEYMRFLDAQINELMNHNPGISGLDIWLAEGAGEVIYYWPEEALRRIGRFLPEWIGLLEKKAREYGLDLQFFTHRSNHTNATRKLMYSVFQDHPDICLTEDITWPEEFNSLPILAFLDKDVLEQFLKLKRNKLNFILDTEYMGQGVTPSILPDWYKQHINYCVHHGITIVSGRILMRDGNYSLTNHNRGNVYCFGAFAWKPDRIAAEVLKEYLALRYGNESADELAGVFLLTEEIIRKTYTINGLGFSARSAFPCDREMVSSKYSNAVPLLKCVEDLARPVGTPLFGAAGKNLKNYEQWRYQLRTYALSEEQYFTEKDEAIRLALYACTKIKNIDFPGKQEVLESFEVLYFYARAMKEYIKLVLADNRGDGAGLENALSGLDKLAGEIALVKGDDYYFRTPRQMKGLVSAYRHNSRSNTSAVAVSENG
ncbi:MAG: hypothetical protein ACYC26_07000 [Phycisphaerales bacterium]